MPKSLVTHTSTELATSIAGIMTETIKILVRYPDQVTVGTHRSPISITLLVKVAPDDIGIVIGKQGRTARSLRILLGSISHQSGLPLDLDIQAEPS